MAIRLVNTTPGDVSGSFLPGTPFVFSLKEGPPFGHIFLPSLQARLGFSNILFKNGVLPELDQDLLSVASVVVRSPEHREPVGSELNRSASGLLSIGPGTSGGIDAGVYEISIPVETYSSVMASVSFRVHPGWSKASRYWSNRTSLLPVYLGLEYGVRNTGLFAFLRDDGATGSLVVGGPLLGYSTERGAQVEYPIGWKTLADGAVLTVFIYIDSEGQTAQVAVQKPTEIGPTFLGSPITLSSLGQFSSAENYSQHRAGPSHTSILYFGNGGDESDTVEFTDFALYPSVPWGVKNGAVRTQHALDRRPDLPITFFSSESRLPHAQKLGRWTSKGDFTPPEINFWYQPGRKAIPLYTTIAKSQLGASYLTRREPILTTLQDGFSVEVWMAGEVETLVSQDLGFGLRVSDGAKLFQVTAVDTEINRTYALLKDAAFQGDVSKGYHLPLDTSGGMRHIDYRGLKLLRLTVDRHRDEVRFYVEDMDVPVLTLPIYSSQLPNANSTEAFVDVGHFSSWQTVASLNVASLSYLNRYLAWEAEDEVPSAAPIPFQFLESGGGTGTMRTGTDGLSKLVIEKPTFGTQEGVFSYFYRTGDFNCARGCQVDFRTRVFSYTDKTGVSDAPGQWTGAGVTVFFGTNEAPLNEALKLHLGFFDCGAYGRKIGIVPGTPLGTSEILEQTELGKLYSADATWTELTSYRLVYQPGHKIEVYGPNLIKDQPIISIPWDKYVPERDLDDMDAGIAFGAFNAHNNCTSEWRYLRWGISTGYELELLQNISNFSTALGGRALALIDVLEALEAAPEVPGTTFVNLYLDLARALDTVRAIIDQNVAILDQATSEDTLDVEYNQVDIVFDSGTITDYADASAGELAALASSLALCLDAIVTVAQFIHETFDEATIVDTPVTELLWNVGVSDEATGVDTADVTSDAAASVADTAVTADSLVQVDNDGNNDCVCGTGLFAKDWATSVVTSISSVDDEAVSYDELSQIDNDGDNDSNILNVLTTVDSASGGSESTGNVNDTAQATDTVDTVYQPAPPTITSPTDGSTYTA